MKFATAFGQRAAIVAALLVLLSTPAFAGSPVPYGGAFREQIEATFFETGDSPLGVVSPSKLQRYRDFIRKKLRVIEVHVVNHETIDGGRDPAKARAAVRGRDTTIALEHILELLDQIERSGDSAEAYDLAAEILMVEYATRSYTDPLGSIKIPGHIKNMIFEWRLEDGPRARRAAEEATNLVNVETGEFYSPDELAELIRSGFDISRLNPPADTPFRTAVDDISKVDVVANYLEGGDPVHAGIVSRFPPFDGAEFELDKAHKTQSKPKLDVFWADAECAARPAKKRRKCSAKVKLKFGMETHADPPANALLAALGFNVDVSMHLKNIRVYLGKHRVEEVEKDWIGYFDRQRLHTYLPLKSMLQEGAAGQGRDERGEYLAFQETVAELKPDELERIGFFPFAEGMAANFREARGLFLFNAWIGNADMKDEENNKLVLRRGADGKRKMYLVQQDIGHSMGWVLPERPEAFPWDLVESHAPARVFGFLNRSIELDYIDLQDTGLERTTTYSDAKWMARLIAQLTRKQIEDALALGHWPGGIAQLYVEKLINRRNQLVQVFDLEDEFSLLPVDRKLTTADGSVVDGELERSRWEGSPIDFDHHWRDVFGPVGGYLADRALQGLQSAIAAIDVIKPGNITIEGKLRVFPRILVNVTRKVILNPEPEGAFDQYIVFDSLQVGVRVGIGHIGSVEGTLLRKIALAYPVSTRSEGIRFRPEILKFMAPGRLWRRDLPDKFVLYREDAFKKGFRLSSDHAPFLSPFGIDADQNWVLAHRSVIDSREANPIVWLDKPRYLEREAHMYAELAVLQIPFLGGSTSAGEVVGEVSTLDGSRLDVAGDDGIPIFEKMVQRADFRDSAKIRLGSPRRASSDFRARGAWWNLIFAYWRTRASDETVTVTDANGRTLREDVQSERRSESAWSFLDNGETQSFQVTGYVVRSQGSGAAPEPFVVASYDIDDLNTHSDEFDSYYGLLEGLAAGEPLLSPDFEAADWEVSGRPSGRWTRLLTHGRVHLYAGALARMTQLDPDRYWEQLAANLALDEREFARQRLLARSGGSKDTLVARRRLADRRVRGLIRRSRAVLRLLDRTAAAGSEEERVRLIVEALYRSTFKSGDTFDPIILATLLETAGISDLVEDEQVLVEARITKAFEDEHNLPERRDAVGRLGSERSESRIDYRFFPFKGIDLYRMLDWVNESE
jgi:hypothetical protein